MSRYPRIIVSGVLSIVMTLVLGAVQQAAGAPNADETWQSPFVAIVWPHDGTGVGMPVASSKAVNVSVWPSNSVSCDTAPTQSITLWQAKNNEPAALIDNDPDFFVRTQAGVKFPSMEFNNESADMKSNPANRYYFMLGGWHGNVWVDATDARTYLPNAVKPTAFSDKALPGQIDARIQIVYPHDAQGNLAAVSAATLDNVAVDLYEHGTMRSVSLNYGGGPIVLYMAEANHAMGLAQSTSGSATVVSVADLEPYKIGTVTYPRWVFNNVKVQPGHQYHFMVRVQGVDTFPTVWTHAEDARTYLPNPPVPPACHGSGTPVTPSPTDCPTAWFMGVAAPGSCPNGASQQVSAAYEPFQRGAMVWRNGLGFDILRNDNGMREGWQNNLTVCRDSSANVHPPAGLFAPTSGFGEIWRGDADYCTYANPDDFDHNHFKNVLGWATAPEAGYTATYQTGTKVTVSGSATQTVVLTYITLPDGKIVELSRISGPNLPTTFRILNP